MRKLAIAAVAGSALLTGVVAASAADMAVKTLPIATAAGLQLDRFLHRRQYRRRVEPE